MGTLATSKREGGYLYYDTVGEAWIRSGKVNTSGGDAATRSFASRDAEHYSNSKKKDCSSNFYNLYPSIENQATEEEKVSSLQVGYFEDLQQHCALGFHRENESHKKLYSVGEDGVCSWTKDVLEKVDKTNFKGATSLQDKQLHIVGYLIELVYDLAISSKENVSESPGFETPLGAWINHD